MTFDGIAAIQARIQSIEQQVGAVAAPATAATAGSGTTNGADFASLLTDAMNTQPGAQTASAISGAPGRRIRAALPTAAVPTSRRSSAKRARSPVRAARAAWAQRRARAHHVALVEPVRSRRFDLGLRHHVAPVEPHGHRSEFDRLLRHHLAPVGSHRLERDVIRHVRYLVTAVVARQFGRERRADRRHHAERTTTQFLTSALSQQGKPYVWGATASPTDASPAAFDCSELTKWAAARSGVTIPDGAAHQYVWLKQQGDTMTVQQALQTPGALLFHFASEPQPGLAGEPPVADVAISLGNGLTIEAKGKATASACSLPATSSTTPA